jgi:hypothetical protein
MIFLSLISCLQPTIEVFTELQACFVFQPFIHCSCGLEVARFSPRVFVSLSMFGIPDTVHMISPGKACIKLRLLDVSKFSSWA